MALNTTERLSVFEECNRGVYIIRNLVNRKVYTGSSVNIAARWNRHRGALEGNRHINSKLQNAWNKYGANNFEFGLIRKCSTDKLLPFEQMVMNRFDSVENGYNICSVAGNILGIKFRLSDDARKKISDTHKGRPTWMKGRYHSEETKKKISITKTIQGVRTKGMLGMHHTPETKMKMSISSKGQIPWNKGLKGVQLPPFLGKHHSPKTKERISEAMKIYKVSCVKNMEGTLCH